MSFSAVLAGANVLTSFMGARTAQKQAEWDRYYKGLARIDSQNAQAREYGAMLDQRRAQQEENAYLRQIEELNRRIKEQERDFSLGEYQGYKDQLLKERQDQYERQMDMDKEAARQREFQLSQLLQNQELAQDERDFAIRQLEEAKAVASGERDDDMRRFYEERAQKEVERDFLITEFEKSQTTRQQERDQEMALRNQILGQIYGLQDTLGATESGLQYVPDVPVITEAQIAAEIQRRSAENIASVDRAADRVASINEADLMRGGIDRSTTGTDRRGDVAARLAQEYQNATSRAYDEAMKYISGQQSMYATDIGNILKSRQAQLEEASGIAGAGIDSMIRLPQISSADNFNSAQIIPSSVYARDIASAGNVRSPVDIGSGIYDSINIGPGMSSYNITGSAATNAFNQLPSSVYSAATLNIPGLNFNNIMSSLNTASSNAATSLSDSQKNAREAGGAFGSALADLGGSYDAYKKQNPSGSFYKYFTGG